MTTMTKTFLGTMTLLGAILIGCDGEKPPVTPPPPQPTAGDASAALPATLFLNKAPDGAQELAAARKQAKPGDEIVVRGRIGGHKDPLAANRAILTLLDNAVPTCERSPMDKCTTPWDACCEPPETLQANTATIQVVDGSGRPLKTGLRGVNGIEPMKELVIIGRVTGQEVNALVIDATGIYVKS